MKKPGTSIYIIILLSSLLSLTQCNSDKSSSLGQMSSLALSNVSYTEIGSKSSSYSDLSPTQNYNYYHLDIPAGENVSFDYTIYIDTGTEPKDVYFIFTNISPDSRSTYPVLESSQSVTQSALPITASKPKSLVTAPQTMKGKPEITEFNRRPFAILNKVNPVNMLLNIVSSPEPKNDSIGNPVNFKIDAYSSIDATCRARSYNVATNYGTKTLNVYVADDQWGSNGAQINQAMADNLANTFLTTNLDNDIYDWVTNIYGEEWGSVSSTIDPDSILIAPNDEITILLLDIDNDKSSNSGVLGYFWAKDNFIKAKYNYSNQRIMFYMDSYLYTNHSDEIISALAHEFQHMIQFYQKTVLRTNGTGTETWIDEMSSMVTEDLVADKLHVNGPRGVSYLDDSAGSSGNKEGRLPLYNYYNDASVTYWYGGNSVLISYSINYALGAYLARNYGGAQFFHDVMYNDKTDYEAIEYALTQYGSSNKFGDILARWGVANLISDNITTPTQSDYQYNSGTWFSDSIDTITYNAGSINLYNYQITDSSGDTLVGPFIYSPSNPMPTTLMPAASNEYYKAADNLTGSQTWHIKLRKNVRMTIVAK